MKLLRKILSLVGLSMRSDHLADLDEMEKLKQALNSKKKDAARAMELDKQYNDLIKKCNQKLKLEEWCDSSLVEFPDETPIKLRQNTLGQTRAFSQKQSFYALTNPGAFQNKAQWALYWCLARASSYLAVNNVIKANRENGVTSNFLDQLALESRKVAGLLNGSSLQITYGKIYDYCSPYVEEIDVGADILVVISGSLFVGEKFAKIFWIQAKKQNLTGLSLS